MSTERKNSVDKHTNILPNIHTSIQTNKHPYKQTKKQTNQLTDRNNLAKILARLTNGPSELFFRRHHGNGNSRLLYLVCGTHQQTSRHVAGNQGHEQFEAKCCAGRLLAVELRQG